ncbi:MAG: hypothetical protein ACI4FY_08725 [Acetatifactor sp.]
MEKIITYKGGSVIEVFPHSTGGSFGRRRGVIQRQGDAHPVLDINFAMKPAAVLVGHWIIERDDVFIYLRENVRDGNDEVITISFEEPLGDVTLILGGSSEFFHRVSRIEIYPSGVNQIKVQTKEDNAEEGRPDIPQTQPFSPAGEQQVQTQPLPPAGEQQAQIERLQGELEREQATSRSLQGIVSAKMEELLGILNQNSAALSADNLIKRQTLETLKQEVDRLQQEAEGTGRQIDEANSAIQSKTRELLSRKEELEALKVQIGDLEDQKEVAELDCEAAQAQLEEIKVHLQLDQETIDLLEDGYHLKHGSISKTLDEAAKELEKAEKKIAFILKLRERFNNAVDDAILCGDGTIPASEEIGENTDGN